MSGPVPLCHRGAGVIRSVRGPGEVDPSLSMVYREAGSTGPAGGEYGDVRARIDDDKLNAYLANNVPALTVPVTIKQFKVRHCRYCILPPPPIHKTTLSHSLDRLGTTWIEMSYLLNESNNTGQSNPTYFLTDARLAFKFSCCRFFFSRVLLVI